MSRKDFIDEVGLFILINMLHVVGNKSYFRSLTGRNEGCWVMGRVPLIKILKANKFHLRSRPEF